MDNNSGTANTHIYRQKRWAHALNVFSLFTMGIFMGIPLIAFVFMIVSLFRAEKGYDIFAIGLGCILAPLIILMVFNLIQITLNALMSFFSYVKITPDGIEQKYPLYKHIRCKWSDVDRLGKFFLADAIYLNSFEVVGLSLHLKSPFRFLQPKQGLISLSGYEGWPDGQLANDLKQYAPKLFESQPDPEEIQPENKETQKEVQSVETPSISQEVRLLAAISHATILFPNIGFVVPIGIYLTQKKKSSYLAFQSLQALIWQIIMVVFGILASSCIMGSIFIPILLTTASQSERLVGLLTGGGLFIVSIISVFLMIFGNLAFVIYGVFGAVMAYQGKDFRYVFIGNRIERYSASTGLKPNLS